MNIIKLNAIDSTNSFLKDLARTTLLEDETVVVTAQQRRGRGQRLAKWESKRGKSLTFSVYRQFSNLAIQRSFDLSMAVSLAVFRVLGMYEIPEVAVKWPNDIMSAQKKCAGILIENTIEANRIVNSVIGIGLNVNEVKFEQLPGATSLHLQTGRVYNLDDVLEDVATEILQALRIFEDTTSEDLQKAYEKVLFRKDKISVFENNQHQKINGIIRGITSSGLLCVEHEDDDARLYDVKQIRLCY